MRLFFYYAFCSVKNQIRRSMKSWIIIFLIFFVLMFAVGSVTGIFAPDLLESVDTEYETEIVISDEEDTEADGIIAGIADVMADESDGEDDSLVIMGVELTGLQIINVVAGLVILFLFFIMILNAEKGASIFLPADAALLFPSPLKPQSVLLFRLLNSFGGALVSSIYIVLQIPSYMSDMGLPAFAVFMTLAAWFLLLGFGKLLQVFLYSLASVREGFRPWIRRIAYLLVLGNLGGLFLYMSLTGRNLAGAVAGYFSEDVTNYIPVLGWLKGICVYAVEGRNSAALICLFLMLFLCAAAAWGIWQIKADFYEDAMTHTEAAAKTQQSDPDTVASDVKRSSKRTAKLTRKTYRYGNGSNVFFYKTLYNHFRYARMGFLTKTSATYLLVSLVVCLIMDWIGTESFFPVVVVLAVPVFYRTLGSPLSEEMQMHFFRLLPESSFSKLFWCVLGGSASTLLDLLPAMILAVIMTGSGILAAAAGLIWLMFLDFFASSLNALINLTTPQNSLNLLKQIILGLFLFGGLIPDVLIFIVGMVFLTSTGGAILAAAFNGAIGAAALAITGAFL